MTETLLPCPFCGGKAELDSQQHYTYMKHGQPRTGTRVVIYCLECSADIGICHEDDECADSEDVAVLWNRRAPVSGERVREAQPDWQHIANEWADTATNALQWLDNVAEGLTPAREAFFAFRDEFKNCRERVALPLAAQPEGK